MSIVTRIKTKYVFSLKNRKCYVDILRGLNFLLAHCNVLGLLYMSYCNNSFSKQLCWNHSLYS